MRSSIFWPYYLTKLPSFQSPHQRVFSTSLQPRARSPSPLPQHLDCLPRHQQLGSSPPRRQLISHGAHKDMRRVATRDRMILLGPQISVFDSRHHKITAPPTFANAPAVADGPRHANVASCLPRILGLAAGSDNPYYHYYSYRVHILTFMFTAAIIWMGAC